MVVYDQYIENAKKQATQNMASALEMKKRAIEKATQTKPVTVKTQSNGVVTTVQTETGEIARWRGHRFVVNSSVIRSFSELSVKGSSEIEEEEQEDEKKVKRKNSKPLEIGLTAELYAATGCNVREEAMAYVLEASNGESDYFYVGNQKLCSHKMMLTSANVTDISFAKGGLWTRANVKLTFKQDELLGGGSASPKATAKEWEAEAKRQEEAAIQKALDEAREKTRASKSNSSGSGSRNTQTQTPTKINLRESILNGKVRLKSSVQSSVPLTQEITA